MQEHERHTRFNQAAAHKGCRFCCVRPPARVCRQKSVAHQLLPNVSHIKFIFFNERMKNGNTLHATKQANGKCRILSCLI